MRAIVAAALIVIPAVGLARPAGQDAPAATAGLERIVYRGTQIFTDATGSWKLTAASERRPLAYITPTEFRKEYENQWGPVISVSWAETARMCAQPHDGVTGWRLPTAAEIFMIFGWDSRVYWVDQPGKASAQNLPLSTPEPWYISHLGTICVHAPYERPDPATIPIPPPKPASPPAGPVILPVLTRTDVAPSTPVVRVPVAQPSVLAPPRKPVPVTRPRVKPRCDGCPIER